MSKTYVLMVLEQLHLYIQLEFHQVDNLFVVGDLANHPASRYE
jgi:hypothetical protein